VCVTAANDDGKRAQQRRKRRTRVELHDDIYNMKSVWCPLENPVCVCVCVCMCVCVVVGERAAMQQDTESVRLRFAVKNSRRETMKERESEHSGNVHRHSSSTAPINAQTKRIKYKHRRRGGCSSTRRIDLEITTTTATMIHTRTQSVFRVCVVLLLSR
jgi:hypothetical protein